MAYYVLTDIAPNRRHDVDVIVPDNGVHNIMKLYEATHMA